MKFIGDWLPLILILAFVFGLLGIGAAMDSASCHAKWEESGFSSRWGLLKGCQIRIDDAWIPSGAYRELDK